MPAVPAPAGCVSPLAARKLRKSPLPSPLMPAPPKASVQIQQRNPAATFYSWSVTVLAWIKSPAKVARGKHPAATGRPTAGSPQGAHLAGAHRNRPPAGAPQRPAWYSRLP
ncbi:hypothetical protein XFLAVUS301_38510 [Xanthobacter flavus]|uniref:Uncharacterized protein n=1 Tax=Xanthobacter flavus TaxID=281 RepID=A0A9W6CQ84_XANFL|nr:hypothetical protein XFLAVUS301_38510 [Xanthobacter flavus]